MNRTQKTIAAAGLAAATAFAALGGNALFDTVKFARASTENQQMRDELRGKNGGDLSDVFRTVGKVVGPSVVQIEVHKQSKSAGFQLPNGMTPDDPDDNSVPQLPRGGGEEIGTGSGVIMDVDGSTAYVLTNYHVAGDATSIVVTLADRRVIRNAKLVGADPKSDLAVVKITADRLIPAAWGDSAKLERGQWVLAFGSPFGYVGSMTHGIVSALDRQAGILADVDGYEDFIQVDAPINPGNSGGPLVDTHGDVVGINTAIASHSGGFQGIGFAIPSNQAKVIYSSLKDKGRVSRGWLGVQIRDVGQFPAEAKAVGFPGDNGVLVDGVIRGTPSFGKLQPGDVVEKVNGKPVADRIALRNEIALSAPGKDVPLTVFRDHKETDVTVRLGEQPDNVLAMRPDRGHDVALVPAATLGLRLTTVTDDLAQRYGLGPAKAGAVVTAVKPNSPAATADVAVGDLITRVGNDSVSTAAEARDALSKSDPAAGVRVYITNAAGYRVVVLGGEEQP